MDLGGSRTCGGGMDVGGSRAFGGGMDVGGNSSWVMQESMMEEIVTLEH
jgi:hypothetical protein